MKSSTTQPPGSVGARFQAAVEAALDERRGIRSVGRQLSPARAACGSRASRSASCIGSPRGNLWWSPSHRIAGGRATGSSARAPADPSLGLTRCGTFVINRFHAPQARPRPHPRLRCRGDSAVLPRDVRRRRGMGRDRRRRVRHPPAARPRLPDGLRPAAEGTARRRFSAPGHRDRRSGRGCCSRWRRRDFSSATRCGAPGRSTA